MKNYDREKCNIFWTPNPIKTRSRRGETRYKKYNVLYEKLNRGEVITTFWVLTSGARGIKQEG